MNAKAICNAKTKSEKRNTTLRLLCRAQFALLLIDRKQGSFASHERSSMQNKRPNKVKSNDRESHVCWHCLIVVKSHVVVLVAFRICIELWPNRILWSILFDRTSRCWIQMKFQLNFVNGFTFYGNRKSMTNETDNQTARHAIETIYFSSVFGSDATAWTKLIRSFKQKYYKNILISLLKWRCANEQTKKKSLQRPANAIEQEKEHLNRR